jgi:hypothetical protein
MAPAGEAEVFREKLGSLGMQIQFGWKKNGMNSIELARRRPRGIRGLGHGEPSEFLLYVSVWPVTFGFHGFNIISSDRRDHLTSALVKDFYWRTAPPLYFMAKSDVTGAKGVFHS